MNTRFYNNDTLSFNPFLSCMKENEILSDVKQVKEELLELKRSLKKFKNDEDEFIDQKKASKILGRSEVSLYRYRRDGILPYQRLAGIGIRYKKSDVLNLLKMVNNNTQLC